MHPPPNLRSCVQEILRPEIWQSKTGDLRYRCSHFPGLEKYQKMPLNVPVSIFSLYNYADTVPLLIIYDLP